MLLTSLKNWLATPTTFVSLQCPNETYITWLKRAIYHLNELWNHTKWKLIWCSDILDDLISFSFVAMLRQWFLNLLWYIRTIHTDLINTEQSPSQHALHMYENISVRVKWMSARASLSMSWFQWTKGSLAWSCSLERGKKRETQTERKREEPVGILSSLRGHCLDATSWHTPPHPPTPKTPAHPHPLQNSEPQTRTATALKINLYTNRLLIIINSSKCIHGVH